MKSGDTTGSGDSTGGIETRRDFLYVATGTLGAVGTAIAIWPFIDSMNPSKDVLALSSIEIDLEPIESGQRITVQWRGMPVFVFHRTEDDIARARTQDDDDMRDPEPDEARVLQPEWLIVVGVCTHLGCIPLGQGSDSQRGNWGGWFCPCHGSHYDVSGRIRKGPAPRNLDVPPYEFLSDMRVRVG